MLKATGNYSITLNWTLETISLSVLSPKIYKCIAVTFKNILGLVHVTWGLYTFISWRKKNRQDKTRFGCLQISFRDVRRERGERANVCTEMVFHLLPLLTLLRECPKAINWNCQSKWPYCKWNIHLSLIFCCVCVGHKLSPNFDLCTSRAINILRKPHCIPKQLIKETVVCSWA